MALRAHHPTTATNHHLQIRRLNLSGFSPRNDRLPNPPPPNLSFNIPLSPSQSLRFSLRSPSISPLCRCASEKSSDSFDSDLDQNYASEPPQTVIMSLMGFSLVMVWTKRKE